MIYTSVEQFIGRTPIIELIEIEKQYNLKSKLYAKVEFFNPSGSIKDRAALYMIRDAEKKGLKKGGTLIEETSGNTGIGLAMLCAKMGYKLIVVMPDNMSIERRKMIAGYGAEVVLTPGHLGMAGSVDKVNELNKQIDGSMIVGQFVNEANTQSHIETTGPEIYSDIKDVDYVVAGIGTGGTITGIGKYFKQLNTGTKIVGVEPYSSPLITKGKAGVHNIQGIGANFIPDILDLKVIDEIIDVKDENSIEMAKILSRKEGLSVGISSGAALDAGIKIAKRCENKKIVVILPDGGSRYLSTELFC